MVCVTFLISPKATIHEGRRTATRHTHAHAHAPSLHAHPVDLPQGPFLHLDPPTSAALTRTSLVAGAQLTDRFVKSLFHDLRYGQVKTLRHVLLGNAVLENGTDHLKNLFHDLGQGRPQVGNEVTWCWSTIFHNSTSTSVSL